MLVCVSTTASLSGQNALAAGGAKTPAGVSPGAGPPVTATATEAATRRSRVELWALDRRPPIGRTMGA